MILLKFCKISQNILYFAKFCRLTSFATQNLANFDLHNCAKFAKYFQKLREITMKKIHRNFV